MSAGKVETNLVRLLSRCESMVSDKESCDWRLEKYLNAMNAYLSQVRSLSANQPSAEKLSDYSRRIELLRGITEAKKLPTSLEKSLAVNLLVPSKLATMTNCGSLDLHIKTKANNEKDLREELLTSDRDVDGILEFRQRRVRGNQEKTDVSTLLQHHNQMQEKLAEEMVYLAKNLKENVSAAGRIVRDDKETIMGSSRLADTNFGKLKVESARLDVHVQRVCNWWLWIMLLVIIVTFIWMVIFMKMFPKK